MNTKSELEVPPKAKPEIFQPPTKADNSSEIIASLEARLEAAQEKHCEERFLWLVGVVALILACFAIAGIGGFGLLILGVLAFVLLAGSANMWGIDWAVQLMDWAMSMVTRRK